MKLLNWFVGPEWCKRAELFRLAIGFTLCLLMVSAVFSAQGYYWLVEHAVTFLIVSASFFTLCYYLQAAG